MPNYRTLLGRVGRAVYRLAGLRGLDEAYRQDPEAFTRDATEVIRGSAEGLVRREMPKRVKSDLGPAFGTVESFFKGIYNVRQRRRQQEAE